MLEQIPLHFVLHVIFFDILQVTFLVTFSLQCSIMINYFLLHFYI